MPYPVDKPLASDIRKVLGPSCDNELALRIIDTGASAGDVQQAMEWLSDDDYMGAELEKTMNSKIKAVYDILSDEQESYGRQDRD